jgi:hypothetical protein
MAGYGEQVSLERLRQLLDQGEGVDLDFKQACDLTERSELVAITKDIAAFSTTGGHIVVGVNEDGTPSGRFTAGDARLFDEATLRGKVAPRYLPDTISITTAVHEIDGEVVAVIFVAAHPNGFVVMQADGDYTRPSNKPAQEFRAGDVFVRRGSSSIRWNHEEADAALERAMVARKEQWRIELRDDLAGVGLGRQAQELARGPAASFTWQLDNDAFTATLVELLRADDDITLTLALNAMSRDAGAALTSGGDDDLCTILDRLASVAAVAITVDRPALLEQAVQSLVKIYNFGYLPGGFRRQDPGVLASADLWLEVISRVYAVGALGVRRRDWAAVKTLTLQKGSGQDFDYYTNWLRHALTEASRAGLLQSHDGQRQIELSLLQLAAEHIDRLPALRPDVVPGDEAILNSLTQFDLLSILTAVADASSVDSGIFYTNFARMDWSRSEPALEALLEDEDMRHELVPLGDQDLADAVREISRIAQSEGFRFTVFGGWHSQAVQNFLRAHPQPTTTS